MKNHARFNSLAARLSLWIISLGTFIFIAVIATNHLFSRELLEQHVSDLAKSTTTTTVQKIEAIFHRIETSTDALAAVVSSANVNETQIHPIITSFIQSEANIFGMTVALEPNTLIDALGDFSPYYFKQKETIAFSDLASGNYRYQDWPWYRNVKQHNAASWSEPYLDEGGGNVLMTTYSTPIHLSDNKTFAGVATADIKLSWLDKIVNEIHIGKNGFGFIVSKSDTIIAHPDKSLNMKNLLEVMDSKVMAENKNKYIDSKSQTATVYLHSPCRHGDGFCWVAIETLGNTGWKVVVILPEKELIADINALTLKTSIIASTGLFVLLFIVITVTRHLTLPLGKLANATKEIGSGKLDTALPKTLHDDEIGTLTDAFRLMCADLKTHIAAVKKSTAKQQKLESEIQIATDIQMSMLPGAGNISLKQDLYQLFAYLKPARSVGGDLYYYQHTGEHLHFIIGDVSDKGVPAALFMAKTITLYTRALRDSLSPGQTLSMMNDILTQNNDACMFVTALCGSINLSNGHTIMSNAGHMNPFLQTTGITTEQDINGATALGLMENIKYPDISFTLDKASSLIMYTDGISEAHDTKGNQYTDKRLHHLLRQNNNHDLEKTGKQILSEVDVFSNGTEQFDDITLLIIRYE